jgi:tetratricopeptide (TPR) repeat protein
MKLRRQGNRVICLAIAACFGLLAEDLKPQAALAQAKALEGKGDPAGAADLLGKAIAAGGDTAELRGELGLILYRSGKFHQAILELGRAAQLDPNSSEYSLKLAAAILAEKRYGVALEYLRSVQGNFERLAEYQYDVGIAYYGLRQYSDALTAFGNALRIAPDMDLAHFFLGNALVANGDLESSVASYRKAITLNPRKAGYYYALGKTLGDLGTSHQQEAISVLRTALQLQPNDTASQFALAKLYDASGDAAAAKPLLESVIGRYPDEIAPRVVLARVYTKLSEPEKAKQQFEAIRSIERARPRAGGSELDPPSPARP